MQVTLVYHTYSTPYTRAYMYVQYDVEEGEEKREGERERERERGTWHGMA